jgi:hypothetical protein
MTYYDPNGWQHLKRELLTRWREINESDLLKVQNEKRSLIDLLEKKVGLKIDDASRYVEEMASRFHIYEEPKEEAVPVDKEKKEKVFELRPKKPANKDLKPKDDFHSG